MSTIDLEHLHKFQLEIALEIKRLCEANHIPYFLVDGSALGAYYLQDFLPWDDDLDIGMYWPDYLRFLEVCKTNLKPRYLMKDYSTDDRFGCSFGQMIDTKTICIQDNNANSDDVKGVFIDIHPFSSVSKWRPLRRIQYHTFKVFKLCLLAKTNYIENRSATKLIRVIAKLIPKKAVTSALTTMRNYKETGLAMKIHGRQFDDYIYINNLSSLQTITFAGHEFLIQPDCRRMLDSMYGEFDSSRNENNRHKILKFEVVE